MTNLGLPPQGAAPMAQSLAASALATDRGAASASDSQDSSAFDALLGALGDSGTQAHPTGAPADANSSADAAAQLLAQSGGEATPAVASWRSISTLHSLGSGVLSALDKRLASTTSTDAPDVSTKTSKTDGETSVDAAALASIGWASLMGSLTVAPVAPAAGAPTSASSASTLAALASAAAATAPVAGNAIAGATIQDAMPSDPTLAVVTPTNASNAATTPVAVNVVRSITYLGLDSTAPKIQSATAAPTRPAANHSAGSTSLQGTGDDQSSVSAPNATGASSGAATGDQSQQNNHGAGADDRASGRTGRTDRETTSVAGQATTATASSGAAQASVNAIAANNMLSAPVAQLADVIASAAGELASQGSNVASSGATANSADAARMAPVKELDVQLNPASLGALTIQMRLNNGNLSVTIKADKSDTLKLIENERSSITDKLQSLNFSVDSLTVKASDAVASGSASADASNTGTSNYGEAQQGQSGQTADGSRDGRFSQGAGDQRQSARQGRQSANDAGGDGNFGHRVV
jgi:flagellar hook-length control protein FliK